MEKKSVMTAMVAMALLPVCVNAANSLNMSDSSRAEDLANDINSFSVHHFPDASTVSHADSANLSVENAGVVITSSVTAVPEPATYALLVTGMVLMGFIGLRRQDKFKL
ncbi:PEP-CTERM sorting domain-containing protein [Methylobacillus caricis]|uniref:PEP-CTERM sorting domain-containing protein n=1 Tax=Methylobacillus caricis TaxID=1971611 RepID=UPI001D0000F6|nr:PEP-CTERM sorting domain-containing protein [Methylobacillus caricis]MCB5188716.1 PEP-CTERM sorting domain-containing protein [Methylobacillus caricis]